MLERLVDDQGIIHARIPNLAQNYAMCESTARGECVLLGSLEYFFNDGKVVTCLWCVLLEKP